MNVQDEPEYCGAPSVFNTWVMAGSSVEVSGFSSCDSCASIYIVVSFEELGPSVVVIVSRGVMSRLTTVVAFATYRAGSSRGDGAALVDGHWRLKPARSSLEGSTRKLSDVTPW